MNTYFKDSPVRAHDCDDKIIPCHALGCQEKLTPTEAFDSAMSYVNEQEPKILCPRHQDLYNTIGNIVYIKFKSVAITNSI